MDIDYMARNKSLFSPGLAVSTAASSLEGHAEEPWKVVEAAVEHPSDQWHEVTIGSRPVDDHLKGVASRGAFDTLLEGPPVGVEVEELYEEGDVEDEELFVRTVDATYGGLKSALDEATKRNVRRQERLDEGHRPQQQSLDDYIPNHCSGCNDYAENTLSIWDKEELMRRGELDEDKNWDNETVYYCLDCKNPIYDSPTEDGSP